MTSSSLPDRPNLLGKQGLLSRRTLLSLLLLGGLAGCSPQELPPSDAVARVGDSEVAYERFEHYLQENVGEQSDLSPEVLTQLFDLFLDEELLLLRARNENLVDDQQGHRQATEALLEAHPPAEISSQELRTYYEQHSEEFERPERVRLRQILVADRPDAERARGALRTGEDFADVARRMSKDPSAPYGGDQGELSREDLPPSFVDAIFRLQEGQVSEIVAADYGFHLFQVVERLPPETVPVEAAEAEIRRKLRRQSTDEQLTRLLDESRERYNVGVFGRNLPFDYRGIYLGSEDR